MSLKRLTSSVPIKKFSGNSNNPAADEKLLTGKDIGLPETVSRISQSFGIPEDQVARDIARVEGQKADSSKLSAQGAGSQKTKYDIIIGDAPNTAEGFNAVVDTLKAETGIDLKNGGSDLDFPFGVDYRTEPTGFYNLISNLPTEKRLSVLKALDMATFSPYTWYQFKGVLPLTKVYGKAKTGEVAHIGNSLNASDRLYPPHTVPTADDVPLYFLKKGHRLDKLDALITARDAKKQAESTQLLTGKTFSPGGSGNAKIKTGASEDAQVNAGSFEDLPLGDLNVPGLFALFGRIGNRVAGTPTSEFYKLVGLGTDRASREFVQRIADNVPPLASYLATHGVIAKSFNPNVLAEEFRSRGFNSTLASAIAEGWDFPEFENRLGSNSFNSVLYSAKRFIPEVVNQIGPLLEATYGRPLTPTEASALKRTVGLLFIQELATNEHLLDDLATWNDVNSGHKQELEDVTGMDYATGRLHKDDNVKPSAQELNAQKTAETEGEESAYGYGSGQPEEHALLEQDAENGSDSLDIPLNPTGTILVSGENALPERYSNDALTTATDISDVTAAPKSRVISKSAASAHNDKTANNVLQVTPAELINALDVPFRAFSKPRGVKSIIGEQVLGRQRAFVNNLVNGLPQYLSNLPPADNKAYFLQLASAFAPHYLERFKANNPKIFSNVSRDEQGKIVRTSPWLPDDFSIDIPEELLLPLAKALRDYSFQPVDSRASFESILPVVEAINSLYLKLNDYRNDFSAAQQAFRSMLDYTGSRNFSFNRDDLIKYLFPSSISEDVGTSGVIAPSKATSLALSRLGLDPSQFTGRYFSAEELSNFYSKIADTLTSKDLEDIISILAPGSRYPTGLPATPYIYAYNSLRGVIPTALRYGPFTYNANDPVYPVSVFARALASLAKYMNRDDSSDRPYTKPASWLQTVYDDQLSGKGASENPEKALFELALLPNLPPVALSGEGARLPEFDSDAHLVDFETFNGDVIPLSSHNAYLSWILQHLVNDPQTADYALRAFFSAFLDPNGPFAGLEKVFNASTPGKGFVGINDAKTTDPTDPTARDFNLTGRDMMELFNWISDNLSSTDPNTVSGFKSPFTKVLNAYLRNLSPKEYTADLLLALQNIKALREAFDRLPANGILEPDIHANQASYVYDFLRDLFPYLSSFGSVNDKPVFKEVPQQTSLINEYMVLPAIKKYVQAMDKALAEKARAQSQAADEDFYLNALENYNKTANVK